MANNTTETAAYPSVLAFARVLETSDAQLHSGRWGGENWQPIIVREKAVRGTISNYLKPKERDDAKLQLKIDNPNLQTIDVATLPADADTLRLSFTLRILGNAGQPCACNNALFLETLIEKVEEYRKKDGFRTLAHRYACNLANGRFLWRNRIGAEEITVRVAQLRDQQEQNSWTFNALDYSLRDFDPKDQKIDELGQTIAAALSNQNSSSLLHVQAFARIGAGQEIFPSQELILGANSNKKGDKSRTLYQLDGIASVHSQKIGNALRTIDNWHDGAQQYGPTAVEPYAAVTTVSQAFRAPSSKRDFYNLFEKWVLKDSPPSPDDQHFVIAVLIRGGVFGKEEKSKE